MIEALDKIAIWLSERTCSASKPKITLEFDTPMEAELARNQLARDCGALSRLRAPAEKVWVLDFEVVITHKPHCKTCGHKLP